MAPKRRTEAQIAAAAKGSKKTKETAAARRGALQIERDAAAADNMPMADASGARKQQFRSLASEYQFRLLASLLTVATRRWATLESLPSGPPSNSTERISLEEATGSLVASIASGLRAADAVLDAQGQDPLHAQEGAVPPMLSARAGVDGRGVALAQGVDEAHNEPIAPSVVPPIGSATSRIPHPWDHAFALASRDPP
jgi:hypothetical protein